LRLPTSHGKIGAMQWFRCPKQARTPRLISGIALLVLCLGAVCLGLTVASVASAQFVLPGVEAPVALPTTVEVSDNATTATVDGDTESLQALITELCRQGEIELRAYGAADRPIRTRYHDVGMRDLFERMLWQENFLLGTEETADGTGERVSWLQVLGDQNGANAPAGGKIASGGSNDGVRELVLPRTGYTTRSATIRRRTAEAFARRLDEDAEARRRFLATPDTKYSSILGKEAYAVAFLNELVSAVTDRPSKLKLERMVRTLQRAKK
jgi:hypothetical protein